MGEVKLMIDGKEIVGEEGMTILQAAEKAGIYIPTLCHKSELSPIGACRVCVVEVEGAKNLVGSCHTPIEDGMAVHTNSAVVLETRKVIIELLLAGHTGPCVTDQRAEACELHNLASDLEVGPPRFSITNPRFYLAEDANPYIRRDMSKCILCRRCIRACSEIAGENIYSIAYRGFSSKVVVDFDEPLNKEVCKDCGICADFCPTSALSPVNGGNESRKGRGTKVRAVTESVRRSAVLGMLKEKQRELGHVSRSSVSEIAETLGLTLSEVYGIATFYSFLSVVPQGRHVIRICKSLPCYMKNAGMIIKTVEKELGIRPGERTVDGRFSFELTNCIGACDKAPAMLVNDDVYGHLTPEKIKEILRSYE